MSICGEPDGGPTKYGVAIVDVCTGMLACNSILAALNARAPHRQGPARRGLALRVGPRDARERRVELSRVRQGRRPVRQRPPEHRAVHDLSGRRRHDRARGRQRRAVRAHRRGARPAGMGAAIRASRRTATASRTATRRRHDRRGARSATRADAWLDKLKAAGVPCGTINSVAQALDDPHTAAREMVETVEHPTVGALKMLGIPFKFTDTPARCGARRRRSASTPTKFSRASLALDARARSRSCAQDKVDPMITGFSHVSIVVPDLEAAARDAARAVRAHGRRAHGQRASRACASPTSSSATPRSS